MVQLHNVGTMVDISVPLEDNLLREKKGYLLGILQLDPDDSNPLWKFLHEHKNNMFFMLPCFKQ